MVPAVDRGFVFADEFCWIIRQERTRKHTALLLAFLLPLGVPLNWKRTKLALINLWLGFHIDPKGPVVTLKCCAHAGAPCG